MKAALAEMTNGSEARSAGQVAELPFILHRNINTAGVLENWTQDERDDFARYVWQVMQKRGDILEALWDYPKFDITWKEGDLILLIKQMKEGM